MARVAIMNASSGRVSWISFTVVQIVAFLRTVKRGHGVPVEEPRGEDRHLRRKRHILGIVSWVLMAEKHPALL